MEWSCLQRHQDGIILKVRVTPNAARTAAEGMRLDRLAVRIKAPPVEGKANEEIRRWAAKAFHIRASSVNLIRGEKAREKDLLLEGVGMEEASNVLDGLER